MSDPLLPAGLPNLLRERSAASAAQDAALRHGVALGPATAQAIAAAVLEFADTEYRVSLGVAPEIWSIADARANVWRNLRRQLAYDLAGHELLPTALPREVVTPGREWDPVKAELVVPVRCAT